MSFTRENHFRNLIQIYDFESIPFLISKGLNNLRLRGFPDRVQQRQQQQALLMFSLINITKLQIAVDLSLLLFSKKIRPSSGVVLLSCRT